MPSTAFSSPAGSLTPPFVIQKRRGGFVQHRPHRVLDDVLHDVVGRVVAARGLALALVGHQIDLAGHARRALCHPPGRYTSLPFTRSATSGSSATRRLYSSSPS